MNGSDVATGQDDSDDENVAPALEHSATSEISATVVGSAVQAGSITGDVIFVGTAGELSDVREAAGSAASSTGRPELSDECPYPGMAAFQFETARWFFGRTDVTTSLVRRVAGQAARGAPLFVVGVSGVGKSSLLCAGLLPAVDRGALSASGTIGWPWVVTRPGDRPLETLVRDVARKAGIPAGAALDDIRADPTRFALLAGQAAGSDAVTEQRQLVLVVDQFEEVFTQCQDSAERAAFLAALRSAAARRGRTERAPAVVVIGLRADFFPYCMNSPDLADVLQDNQFLLGALREADLCEAVERPAELAGLRLDPALLPMLLRDLDVNPTPGEVAGEGAYRPGLLPLLGYALMQTWQRQRARRSSTRDRTLTLADYEHVGRLRGAVAAKANELFDQLSPDEQLIARRLLLRLVTVNEGAEPTRRRVARAELVGGHADIERVLEYLVRARLVTATQQDVEITHEALLRAWSRFGDWIIEDHADLLVHRQLDQAATSWLTNDRDEGYLYRGARLVTAVGWMDKHEDELTAAQREFMAASVDADDARRRTQRRRNRQLRQLVGALAVLLVLALVATGIAVWQQRTAAAATAAALSRQYAAESINGALNDPRRAMLLALAGWQTAPTDEARGALLVAGHNEYAGTLIATNGATNNPDDQHLTQVAISPDGTIAAIGQETGTVRLWDTRTHRQIRQLVGPDGRLAGLAFSPDGRSLITSHLIGGPRCQTMCLRVWNAASGALIRSLPLVGPFALSLDGTTLAATIGNKITWWNLVTNQPDTIIPGAGDPNIPEMSIAVSPDGHTVATGDSQGTVRLWDRTTGQLIAGLSGHRKVVTGVAFSPDGSLLASGSSDGTVRLWNVATHSLRTVLNQPGSAAPSAGDTSPVSQVAFSPDGTIVAAASRQVQRWLVADGSGLNSLAQSTSSVFSVGYSANGHLLISGNSDGTATLWNTGFYLFGPPAYGTSGVAYNSDGSMIATADGDGTIDLWDAARRRLLRTLTGHTAAANDVAFSPRGNLIASTADDGTVRLWNAHTGLPGPVLTTGEVTPGALAFSPDGQTLAVATRINAHTAFSNITSRSGASTDNGYPVLRWQLPAGTPLPEITIPSRTVIDLAYSPTQPRLALALDDGQVRLVDAHTNALVAELPRDPQPAPQLLSVAFSPDGWTLAAAGADRSAHLWALASGTKTSDLTGHTDAVAAVAFSPGGHVLATASFDNTIRLWPLDTDSAVGAATLNDRPDNEFRDLAVSPDGHNVAAVGTDGVLRIWTIDPHQALATVCAALSGPTMAQEWANLTHTTTPPPCP